jgi:signal transduction histidine kinase
MARPLSLGARWTLRYAVFTSVALGLFAWLLYAEFRERVERDASLVVRLQLRELSEELETHRSEPEELRAYLDAHVASAAQDLRLGIRLLDREGRVWLEKGMPEAFPAPAVLPAAGETPRLEELALGEKYPYYSTVRRVGDDYVQVAMHSRAFERSTHEMRDLFLFVLPPMILATSLFGWWLVRGMLRPIAQIDEAARRISASRLEERIALSGSGDELDRLAATVNEMTERLHGGVGQIRRFASSAAHELRAPISRLRHRIEDALWREREPGADAKLLGEMLDDVDGIARTVSALLELAHCEGGLDESRLQEVELSALLDGVADFFGPSAEARGVSLHRGHPAGLRLRGEPHWLRQLFANLVDNAIKFSERGGRVEIDAEETADAVEVRVHDYGLGVGPDERERIFEPFQRGAGGEGTAGVGLGLALARQIALAHGGDLEVDSTEGQGATFVVRLPRPR